MSTTLDKKLASGSWGEYEVGLRKVVSVLLHYHNFMAQRTLPAAETSEA